MKGVSVIICCYNSAKRIQKTLDALLSQEYEPHMIWEVILVDNNSTDGTADIARTIWKNSGSAITLHSVKEEIPGLGNARRKGTSAAAYSILLFCDDDNWLAPNYIQKAYELMQGDLSIAACGGMGIPVFESEEPHWFYMYSEAFALGSQEINEEDNRILNLYGAGLAVQKKALETFYQSGFDTLLAGRTGDSLSSSEDTELTYAFVLMGYKLIYSEDLKFFHYLTKERLTFDYLKKLFIAFGKDGPVRNLYYAHISNRFFHKRITSWNFHLFLSLYRLIKYFISPPKKFGRLVYFNWSKAYIRQLLHIRKDYADINNKIASIKEITQNVFSKSISKARSFSIQADD